MTFRVPRRTIAASLGPAVAALALVGIAPLLYAVWKSLHYFNLTKLAQQKFVGLDNYASVLTDLVFWQAMGRTALLFVIAVPVEVAFEGSGCTCLPRPLARAPARFTLAAQHGAPARPCPTRARMAARGKSAAGEPFGARRAAHQRRLETPARCGPPHWRSGC